MVGTKKEYDWENAKGLPVDFEASPPPEYEGDMDTDVVLESQGDLLRSRAAQRAGAILAQMDKQDMDALYEALAPLTKKIRWYITRYNAMQDKIWYLSDENKKLLKKLGKLRSILQENGIEITY